MRSRTLFLCLAVVAASAQAQPKAKNVILFLGDAGGLSTLSAASIYGHKAPQKLFLQHMPYIGLSDTSPAAAWVTDSAAGMTAIVTGQKTTNGTLSQTPDGKVLKTILEYAEEHGLATGVVSNMAMADATPAACYAHVDSRKKFGEIFQQVWQPRFGDGVDVVLGSGRTRISESLKEMNLDLDAKLKASGHEVFTGLSEIPASAKRAVVLVDDREFKVDEATAQAIRMLSKNPKGFFLMVEWDLHPTRPASAMETVNALDHLIERTVKSAPKDTLVIFTADHSFDFRLRGGKRDQPLNLPADAKQSAAGGKFDAAVGTSHTGEEVIVAAQGPGAEAVHGFMPNTQLFQVMLNAWGWKE